MYDNVGRIAAEKLGLLSDQGLCLFYQTGDNRETNKSVDLKGLEGRRDGEQVQLARSAPSPHHPSIASPRARIDGASDRGSLAEECSPVSSGIYPTPYLAPLRHMLPSQARQNNENTTTFFFFSLHHKRKKAGLTVTPASQIGLTPRQWCPDLGSIVRWHVAEG